jgi:hypothetical protein
MVAFRVRLNGKQLVTAGLPGHHVVSAIICSVVRHPEQRSSWPADRPFVQRELDLSVGGLDIDNKQHVDWLRRKLKVGDRIELELTDSEDVDKPVRRTQRETQGKAPAKASSASVTRRSASPKPPDRKAKRRS